MASQDDKQGLELNMRLGDDNFELSQNGWGFDPSQDNYQQQAFPSALDLDNIDEWFNSAQTQYPPSDLSDLLSGFGASFAQKSLPLNPSSAPYDFPFHQHDSALPFPPVVQPPLLGQFHSSNAALSPSTYPVPSQIAQQLSVSPFVSRQKSILSPTMSSADPCVESHSSFASSSHGQQECNATLLKERTQAEEQASDLESALHQTSAPVDQSTTFELFGDAPNGALMDHGDDLPPPATPSLDSTVKHYLSSPNRLDHGERKIIVMSPKVGQKSYGKEKRFLCPHPRALLVGRAWWTKSREGCPVPHVVPPRVNISLSGEQPVKDTPVSWTAVDGSNLDDNISTQPITLQDKPFLGKVSGKNLYMTGEDGKRREVKALIEVNDVIAQHAGPHGWGPAKGTMSDNMKERAVGTFESKDIKIISKPKKRQSQSKFGERGSNTGVSLLKSVLIENGSTVALFNRVKSQTTSTRYLSVHPDLTRLTGSDGLPATGADPPLLSPKPTLFPGFTTHATDWESFIIWLVDLSRPGGPGVSKPLHLDWPSAPANAIAPSHLPTAIRYNSAVILQSLQTGICSPVLIVRRIDQDSDVIGGDGTFAETSECRPDGETPGDLVSQLQKTAFEVYQSDTMDQASVDSRYGGLWLSCDQSEVEEKFVQSERRWLPIDPQQATGSRPPSVPSAPIQHLGVSPETQRASSDSLPSKSSSQTGNRSSLDSSGPQPHKPSSGFPISEPNPDGTFLSTDCSPVRRLRTASANHGLGGPTKRKRPQSTDGAALSAPSIEGQPSRYGLSKDDAGLCWTLDVGDMCVWSIVSTEQITYTFYVPPHVRDIVEPITPVPNIFRLLPPSVSKEMVPVKANVEQTFTSRTEAELVTL